MMITFSVLFSIFLFNEVTGDQVCYPPYGCFSDDAPFDEALMQLPQSPEIIRTRFLLYTRLTSKSPQVLRDLYPSTIKNSSFSSSRRTTFIIHGYMENDLGANKLWIPPLIEALLRKDDFNVIDVNWKHGAHFPYQRADGNTRLVGAQISHLLKVLNTTAGMKYSDVYIIGFSLGAQIAGYAGRNVRRNGHIVDRITGLDPAAPYHEYKPIEARLDSSDAGFVDVIHTDKSTILIKGMGVDQRAGHVDFYANGGYEQPGCRRLKNGPILFFICSHFRAPAYFIESIHSPCPFLGYECNSYKDFKNGQCTSCPPDGCPQMGYYADKYRRYVQKRLYMKTASRKAFCVFHYRITLHTGNGWFADLDGQVKLILHGSNDSSKEIALDYRKLDSGSVEHFLATSHTELGSLRKVKVWHTGIIDRWYLEKIVIKPSWTITEYVGCYKRWLNSRSNVVDLHLKTSTVACWKH